MRSKNLLVLMVVIAAGVGFAEAAEAAVFAEFDPFSGNQSTITGSLGGNNFSASISGQPTSIFAATSVVSDNTSSTFSDPALYDPSGNNLDRLGLTYFNMNPGASSTLTFTFDDPVLNPVFHFKELDASGWDFGGTSGFTGITRRSGNDQFGVRNSNGQFGVSGRVVQDMNGSFVDGGGADGSVQLNGSFTTVTIDWFDALPSDDRGDGFSLQISTEKSTTSTPEPSTLLGLGTLALATGTLLRRKRKA